MTILELRDWTLALDVDRVLRNQGADPQAVRERRPALVEAAEWALQEAIPLLEPAVIAQELEVKGLRHERLALAQGELTGKLIAQHLGSARRVILMICTIGSQLDSVISDLMTSEPHLGMAFDAVGTAAIIELSQESAHFFEQRALRDGLHTSIPLSPGMIGWPVTGQRQIFSLLEPGRIGVSLTESDMMRPLKSVTQVLGVGENMIQGRTCDFCSLKDTCRYQDHYAHA